MTGLYNKYYKWEFLLCVYSVMSMVECKEQSYTFRLIWSFVLFFRFDFCVPTSDEKTPTENLGQVNNNNIEFNSYDFDQVDLNQPKGTISTLSRLHEFFLQCYNKTLVTLDIHSPCSVCTSATI